MASILKDSFHNSVANSVYKEVLTNVSKYYYFLGRSTAWPDELAPSQPIESAAYEREVRDNIITVKEIAPTEVSYVIPRINWVYGEVYDEYDDQYSTEIQGINLISGGSGYSDAPNVYIGSTGSRPWAPNTEYTGGELLSSGGRYYIVESAGTSGSVSPTHTSKNSLNGSVSLRYVVVNDGGGSQATAVATVDTGSVIDITLTNRGYGYTSHPSVHLAGVNGTGAEASSVVTLGSRTTAQRLEDAMTYVMTDEFYVYQCLSNNNGGPSIVQPTGTDANPVKTSDGYIWKFLYMIPISMRNQFVTSSYIPVISALTNQYYSSGSIQNISLIDRGSNYTSAKISVTGDGYLEANPRYLTGTSIISGGLGYTETSSIEIQPPFTNTITWTANGSVSAGLKIRYLNRIYEVVNGGVLGNIAPTHKLSNVSNGDVILSYIGEIPDATVTIADGSITDVTLFGDVAEINVDSGGFGYISRPNVYVVGDGDGVVAQAIINGGSVQRVDIYEPGSGFTETPTVVIGEEWQLGTPVSINDQVFSGDNLYTVTVAGTTGNDAPTHAIGSVTNGTATLTYAGPRAIASAVIKFGAGYSFEPTITVSDSAVDEPAVIKMNSVKTNARLQSVVNNGEIVAVNVIDGGVGYTYASLMVSGDGSGANIAADLSVGDVNTIQSTIELLTVDGQITNIVMVSSGYGYGTASVSIEGDGIGAKAEPVIINGRIARINVTDYGSNYRTARVIINGNGFGAKARAVMSPYGGFGKNAIKTLNARSLMFCANIFLDTNRGFQLDNDYRQIGIVRAMNKYGSTESLSQKLSTPCWVIGCGEQYDLTIFNTDDVLTRQSDGSRYRIISKSTRAILVLSMDNMIPSPGDIFSLGVSSFAASTITPPNVDKYSGDMLFVDNQFAFIPSSEQRVTLRTVLKF